MNAPIRVLIDATNEAHIMAMAEALFNHEPRNHAKRFADAASATRDRYVDRAAWTLSQASKELAVGL